MPKFGIKNTLLRYFWAEIFKKLLSYLKSATSCLSNCKFLRKSNFKLLNKQCLNLGPKMPYLGIFELRFEKTIVMFEINPLKLV